MRAGECTWGGVRLGSCALVRHVAYCAGNVLLCAAAQSQIPGLKEPHAPLEEGAPVIILTA